MKLSTKVSVTLLPVLMTAMAVSGWFSISEQRRVLGELLRDRGQSLAHAIAVFCIETLLSEDYPILNTFLETTGREREDILSIEVSHQGTLVSSYHSGGEEDGDRIVFQSDILFAAQPGRQPIKLGEVRLGLSDLANKMIIASRIRESVTHTVVIFMLLSGALLLAMRKVVLQKIQRLDRHARRIGNGRLDLKIDLQTDDELGKLAQTLNDMVAKLKASQEELQLHQEHLELLVKERTRELEESQEEVVNKAMEAGRAQLAAMVLHNIGNAMTPFNVQIEAMRAGQSKTIVQYLEKCYHQYLEKCYHDLRANIADLNGYVNADPRGKEIFRYMGDLIAALKAERNRDGDALQKMDRSMAYVSEILTMQQACAASEQEIKQSVYLNALIDDAISIQMGNLEKKASWSNNAQMRLFRAC